ncbi:MAG: F0F1 ATP synthase subunit delta [Candidatus Omnitrophica bacterium]|nr:F0F1 ATP synthase subunit delta [Candidatus Omnitrophota bacterium]
MLIQLLIIQILTFAGIIIVLRLLFQKNLNSALKRLRQLHEQALIKEAELKEKLEKAEREKEAEIEKGRLAAQQILDAAKKETETLRLNSEEQAKQQTQKILSQGKDELEKLRANLLSEIETKALHLSSEMIKYAFSAEGKAGLQRQLIDETIQEINNLESGRFSVKTDQVRVISSFPLTDQEKERLANIISEKTNLKVSLKEDTDPELITGLVLEIGDLIIDGSLKNKLKKVIPYLKNR